jgi:hypothetical protein
VATLGGRLSVAYGFGPGTLSDVHIKAGFNPLEEDSQLTIDGGAKLAIPAFVELSLGLRAGVGLSIKLARVTGGITATGTAALRGGFEGQIELHYRKNAFSVEAQAAIRAKPSFRLGLDADVTAEIGAWGLSRQWQKVWKLYAFEWGANVEAGLIARIGYSSDKGLLLPPAGSIQWIVPNIDTGTVLRDLYKQARSQEKG